MIEGAGKFSAAALAAPGCELWVVALLPPPFDPKGVDRAVSDAIRYATANGMKLAGIRLAVNVPASATPPEIKVRRWLKHLLRTCGMQCLEVHRRHPTENDDGQTHSKAS